MWEKKNKTEEFFSVSLLIWKKSKQKTSASNNKKSDVTISGGWMLWLISSRPNFTFCERKCFQVIYKIKKDFSRKSAAELFTTRSGAGTQQDTVESPENCLELSGDTQCKNKQQSVSEENLKRKEVGLIEQQKSWDAERRESQQNGVRKIQLTNLEPLGGKKGGRRTVSDPSNPNESDKLSISHKNEQNRHSEFFHHF